MPVIFYITGAIMFLLLCGRTQAQSYHPPPHNLQVGSFGLPSSTPGSLPSHIFGFRGHAAGSPHPSLQFSEALAAGKWKLSGYIHNNRIWLNWQLPSQLKVRTILLEESVDGKAFHPVTYLPASPGQAASYNMPSPRNATRYFRIRIPMEQGEDAFSNAILLHASRHAAIESTQFTAEFSSNLFRLLRRDGITSSSPQLSGAEIKSKRMAFEEFENRRGRPNGLLK